VRSFSNECNVERDLEKRVTQLESDYENDVRRMLQIMQKVERRLVGSIENDTPGLISEVRDLKKELADVAERMTTTRAEIEQLHLQQVADAKTMQELTQMKEQLPKIWSKIRVYERYRWLILGGLFVLGLIANKAWDYWMSTAKDNAPVPIHGPSVPGKQP
jgi:hypothetical protein